jgi:hypothetical protein
MEAHHNEDKVIGMDCYTTGEERTQFLQVLPTALHPGTVNINKDSLFSMRTQPANRPSSNLIFFSFYPTLSCGNPRALVGFTDMDCASYFSQMFSCH